MADIFVSYAREDQARIQPLVAAFEAQGWSVFWDRRIPAGQTWRDYIGKALQQARCVVVAWSAQSVASQWVAEEADEGRSRAVLVPVLLEAVQPPRGFREIQAADLSGWRPGEPSERFDELMIDLRRLLGPAPATAPAALRSAPAPAPAPTATAPVARRGWIIGTVAVLVVAIGAIYATQALRERNVRSAATQAAAAAPPARATPAGEWLVVAGSFARGERAAAEQRRQLLAAAGVEASVVDSNQFPLLAPNLLVVAIGPFESKDEVEAASRRARTVVPDAYPKRAR
jgi:hypothetical protein